MRNVLMRVACFLLIAVCAVLFIESRGGGTYEEEHEAADAPPIAEQYETATEPVPEMIPTFKTITELKNTYGDDESMLNFIYNYEKSVTVSRDEFNIDAFLEKDFKTDLTGNEPKILIFHTHATEAFIDSRPNEQEDTIVGVGRLLAEILVEDYNIAVVHDTGSYEADKATRSYERMEPAVKKILEKYPSIEILIDMHRDGVAANKKFAAEIDGKPTAQIMFFNGTYRTGGNPFLSDNLALSFHMQLTANELYPGFARKMYLKPNKYSQHFKPKSLLIEVGANTNTVEEAKNAMLPLSRVISAVFQDKEQ